MGKYLIVVVNDEKARLFALEPVDFPELESSNDWRFPAPTVERRDGSREVQFTIVGEPLKADAPPLDELPLLLTLVDGTRGAEFGADAIAVGEARSNTGSGLLAMLLIALLGGLILNLMPCVLPGLSLKLLSVVSHGGGQAPYVRRSFLATSAGIVAAFLILALALIALRASGTAFGSRTATPTGAPPILPSFPIRPGCSISCSIMASTILTPPGHYPGSLHQGLPCHRRFSRRGRVLYLAVSHCH